MDDENIEFLVARLADGCMVLLLCDVAQREPGSLTRWHTSWQEVVRITEIDDEPVAVIGDGTYAALWACDLDHFRIYENSVPFPAEPTPDPSGDRQ